MTPRIRWGLCCQFLDASIRFRTTTHRFVGTLEPAARRDHLASIARDNAGALASAIDRCRELGIGAFRITSGVLPLVTHPVSGYRLEEIDDDGAIVAAFRAAGAAAREADVRLSFHPDQFVVLNSAREAVVASSIAEMDAQGAMSELIGADTLTLHAGGAAGGIPAALDRLERGIDRLSPAARARIALENDDRCFAPATLLPVCERMGIPFVYDVHHHRCNPDGMDVDTATRRAAVSWGAREPYFHISSPRDGWGANARPHADYVTPADFPALWRTMPLTVDVEAKAKERAVIELRAAVETEEEEAVRNGDYVATNPA